VTPADFQALLVTRLRNDGWTVEELGPLEVRVAGPAGKGQGVFNLGNTYRQYLNGALIGDLSGALIQTLQEAGEVAPVAEALELERLMPLLKTRDLLGEVARTKVEPIAWQPFITDDLIVTLVLDYPQSVRYVRDSEVAASGRDDSSVPQSASAARGRHRRARDLMPRASWRDDSSVPHRRARDLMPRASGKDFDDLLEVALANLYERTRGEVYEVGDEQTGKLFILATQDGYDATRILLSPLLERLAGRVSGELVVGIPNRDFFIAFGNANPLLVGQVGQQIKRDAQARSYPLTETLFTFRNGVLEIYDAKD